MVSVDRDASAMLNQCSVLVDNLQMCSLTHREWEHTVPAGELREMVPEGPWDYTHKWDSHPSALGLLWIHLPHSMHFS